LAAKLNKEVFTFTIKAGNKGEVFGSVSKKDLDDALKTKGYIDVRVVLSHPIKSTGTQEVEVNFHHGVKAKMRLDIKAAV
jgi:large subunit ribosomal protein L9